MSFIQGFEKSASVLNEAGGVLKALGRGVSESGKHSLGDTLSLKGLKHVHDASKKAGGLSKAVKSKFGREAVAEGLGKSLPSIAVAGAGAVAAKKIYNRLEAGKQQEQYYQY